jgi:UPF0271 protein
MKTPMHSICVHGDTLGAVDSARQLAAALQAAGWQLLPLPEILA